ncbi:hypothetical protein T439DRAFT_378255 [Meredithblackwellia eburnea MCA 4105]
MAPPSPTEPDASGFSLIGHSASEVHLTSLAPPASSYARTTLERIDSEYDETSVHTVVPVGTDGNDLVEDDEESEDDRELEDDLPPRVVDHRDFNEQEEEESDSDEEANLGVEQPLLPAPSPERGRRTNRRPPLRPQLKARWSSTDRRTRQPQSLERKIRKVETYLVYTIFIILGASTLLGWNTVIVAGRYFKARLVGTVYEASFAAFVGLTFTVSNLGFLYIANKTQKGANLTHRIQASIIVLAATVALFIYSTTIIQIDGTLFFWTLILFTIILAASASYLQNAVVALSSRFGPFYFQGILLGQGAVAASVACMQFVSAYTASPGSDSPGFDNDSDDLFPLPFHQTPFNRGNLLAPVPDAGVLQSAFNFFLAVGIFTAVACIAHAFLLRLPLYKTVIQLTNLPMSRNSSYRSESKARRLAGAGPKISVTERKVRHLGLVVFWVFTVSISVFPSTTSSILSVHDPEHGGDGGGLGSTLSAAHLFVPLGFIVFAVGDWFGRLIAGIKKLTFTNWKLLALASVARTLFVPLFLLCNVHAGEPDTVPYINSDFVFLFLLFCFSTSNGYISSLVFLAAVVEPTLEEEEIDIAATCITFYLTAGLAAGSLLSFPIRAAICHCNPFT